MKKIISLMIITWMLNSVCSYASVIDNNDMTVEIVEETNIANTVMDVEVINPGYKFSDLLSMSEGYIDVIAYRETVKTDANGKLSLKFALRDNAKSGDYTVSVTGNGYKSIEEYFIVNDTYRKTLIDNINGKLANETDAIAEISASLKSDYASLGVENEYCSKMQDEDFKKSAKVAYNYIKTLPQFGTGNVVSSDNIAYIMNKATIIVAVENKMVENLMDDVKGLAIDEGELSDWYKREYVTENTWKSITERLKGISYEAFEKFDSSLTEAFVLSVMEKPNGVNNAREVMSGFSKYIGTGSAGSDKRYESVSNKYFKDYKALADAFDGYEDKKPIVGGNSSVGSSGGFGGGGIVPDSKIDLPAPQTEKEEGLPLNIFSDIESVAWAEDAIVALAEKGIINGKQPGIFAPNDYVTREEFTAMLIRAFLSEQKMAEIVFDDVIKGEWYYESIAKAVDAGIIEGISENMFGVGDRIIRQDMAVMVYRIADYADASVSATDEYVLFEDDYMISDYAKEAVYSLKGAGVIKGIDEYTFAPFEYATRAQAAKIIYTLSSL